MGKTNNNAPVTPQEGGNEYLDKIYNSYVGMAPKGKTPLSKEAFTEKLNDEEYRAKLVKSLSTVYDGLDVNEFNTNIPIKKKEVTPSVSTSSEEPISSSSELESGPDDIDQVQQTYAAPDWSQVTNLLNSFDKPEEKPNVELSDKTKQEVQKEPKTIYDPDGRNATPKPQKSFVEGPELDKLYEKQFKIPGLTAEENDAFRTAAINKAEAGKQLAILDSDPQTKIIQAMGGDPLKMQLAKQTIRQSNEQMDNLLMAAKFRDDEKYFSFYDADSLKPVAIPKDQLPDFLQQFMDNEFKTRKDIVNDKKFSKEFQGKKFTELDPSQQLVVQTAFAQKYIPKDQVQEYLISQNINFDLNKAPQAANSLAKGFFNTTASIAEGADPSKLPTADGLNAAIVKAKTGMITKTEYERLFSEIQDNMMVEVKDGVLDTYEKLPGINPIKTYEETRSPLKMGAIHYVYSEDQIARYLGKMPKYDDLVKNPETVSPFTYENGQLGKAADALNTAASKMSHNPVYDESFLLTKVPEALGSSAAFVATSLISRGLNVPSAFVTALTGGFANASDAYNQAIQGGASPDKARQAYWGGFGIGTSEVLPIERMLNRFHGGQGWKQKLLETFNQGNEELIQETFQGLSNDVLAQLLWDESKKIGADLKSQAAVGWASGFLMGGVTALGSRPDITPEQQKMLEEIKKNIQFSIDRADNPIEKPTEKPVVEPKQEPVVIAEEQKTVEPVKPEKKTSEVDKKPDNKTPLPNTVSVEYNGKNYDVVIEGGLVESIKEEGGFKADLTVQSMIEINKLAAQKSGKVQPVATDGSKKAVEIIKNEKSSLGDLLEHVNGPYEVNADKLTELDDKIDAAKKLLKASPKNQDRKKALQDLQAEKDKLDAEIYNQQLDINTGMVQGIRELADEIGVDLSNESDEDINEHIVQYMVDGRYMENVYNKMTAKEYTAELIKDYAQSNIDESNNGGNTEKTSEKDGKKLIEFKKGDVVYRNYNGRYEEYTITSDKGDLWKLEGGYNGSKGDLTLNAANNSGFILKENNTDTSKLSNTDIKKGDTVYDKSGAVEVLRVFKGPKGSAQEGKTLVDIKRDNGKKAINMPIENFTKELPTDKAKKDIEEIVKKSGAPEGKVIIGSVEKPKLLGEMFNDKSLALPSVIKGRFLSSEQSAALEKEIEDNYNKDGLVKFGNQENDIRKSLFNINTPIVSKNVNGIDVRVIEGLTRKPENENPYKTYYVYANGVLAGEFLSVDDAKKAIDFVEKHLVKTIGGDYDKNVGPGEKQEPELKVVTDTQELLYDNNESLGKNYYEFTDRLDELRVILADDDRYNRYPSSETKAALNKLYQEVSAKVKGETPTTSKKETVQAKVKAKIKKIEDSELDDLWDDFSSSITVNALLNPEQLGKGLKIIAKYAELGTLKFADIILDATARIGDAEKVRALLDAIKQAYGSYYFQADKETRSKMDSADTLDDFDFDVLINENDSAEQTSSTKHATITPKESFIGSFTNQFLNDEKRFDIRSLRKLADSTGLKDVKDTTIQEYVELALVDIARRITDRKNLTDEAKLERLEALYDLQPTISMRSSERIEKQQYSTPIPISFIAGMFVGKGREVLEPSAGNGGLTIYFDKKNVVVNEIDPVRIENLQEQGFADVTTQDALKPFDRKFDGVVMNPPFGSSPTIEVDGYKFGGLDEKMVVNALQSLKPNGKAAIIIGGHNSYDDKGRLKAERVFFNYLYNHYNVADVINVDGDLYRKQGTSFPIRLILINGIKKEPTGVAPLEIKAANEVVTSFEELFNRVNTIKDENLLQSGMDEQSSEGDNIYGTEQQSTESGTSITESAEQDTGVDQSGDKGKRKSGKNDRGKSGGDTTGKSDSGRNGNGDNGKSVLSNGEVEISKSKDGTTTNDTGGSTEFVSDDESGRIPRKFDSNDLTNEKVEYLPKSGGNKVGSVLPVQMAVETEKTLSKIAAEKGGIDRYVFNKLGYKTKEELYNAFSAEQIDGIAIAIYQIENGKAAIIGDMTGVGKGRIAAGVVRYAIKQGNKPIFMTEKPNLFSDLYRDLVDIGSPDYSPFIINDKSSDNNPDITDKNGDVVYKSLPSSKKKVYFENGFIPDEYDFVMATYSQFTSAKPTVKKSFLAQIAPGSILIMDESHNVSGTSNSGEFFQTIVTGTAGVTFLSATFAKRPDNMPVYALKTSMSEANMTTEELINAVQSGGVALQEVVSALLVESGQMIRRERSFDGVETQFDVLDSMKEYHRNIADKITTVIRELITFQRTFVNPVIEMMDTIAAGEGGRAGTTTGTADVGIKNTDFASKVFNVISQMLFAIKSQEVADIAISELKAGRKPVIVFSNTMGSFLESMGVEDGDVLENADFSETLIRALNGTMRYTITSDTGDDVQRTLSPNELSKAGKEEYFRLYNAIKKVSTGISMSPIDSMIYAIEKAGFKTGEMTGRKNLLELQDDGSAIVKRKKEKDIKKIARDFNAGTTDVVLLNAAGATGISLHASKTFKDQRQRVMLSAQLQLDINKEIQARGRIDRTGQVKRGAFRYVVSAIPAESRLLMMFKQKLKSLDANTTSSQKSKQSSIEIDDFLNKYGDQVVLDYLIENEDINIMMNDPLKLQSLSEEEIAKTRAPEGAARKVTGQVAILPTALQESFYNDVAQRYRKLIDYLETNNENDLEIKVIPLNAKTLKSRVTVVGRGGDSPFGADSNLETLEVDILKKPMKIDEIKEVSKEFLDGRKANEVVPELINEHQTMYEERLVSEELKIRNEYAEKINLVPDKVDLDISNGKDIPDRSEEIATRINKLEEAREARINKMLTREENKYQTINDYLDYFSMIGRAYKVPMGEREETAKNFSNGILIGIYFGNSKYKYNPGNVELKFAVSDGRRIVTVPMSKTNYINSIISTTAMRSPGKDVIENWDNQITDKPRGIRYAITGNLLQAYAHNDGQLVSYTTQDGQLKKGLLLPEYFKPEGNTIRLPINQATNHIKDLFRPIKTVDGEVTIEKERGLYLFSVPLSKSSGGKYFLDPQFRELVSGNDFRQSGTKMIGAVSESNLQKVLNLLSSKHSSSVEINADEYEQGKNNADDDVNEPVSFASAKKKRTRATMDEVIRKLSDIFPNVVVKVLPQAEFETELENNIVQKFSDEFTNYGFFNPRTGEIVLNQTEINPLAAIEEFSHLWLHLLKNVNNPIYVKGEALAKQNPLYEELKADEAYKDIWNNDAALTNEVMAKLIRDKVYDKLDANTRNWVRDVWDAIKNMLRKIGFNLDNTNINTMTLEQLVDKATKDLTRGVPVTYMTSEQIAKLADVESPVYIDSEITSQIINPTAESKFAKRVRHFLRNNFMMDRGAGKTINDIFKRHDFDLNARRHEMGFLMKDMRSAIKQYAKGLDLIGQAKDDKISSVLQNMNSYLHGEVDLETLPPSLRQSALKVRTTIDLFTRNLMQSRIALDDDIIFGVNDSLELYLQANYQHVNAINERLKFRDERLQQDLRDIAAMDMDTLNNHLEFLRDMMDKFRPQLRERHLKNIEAAIARNEARLERDISPDLERLLKSYQSMLSGTGTKLPPKERAAMTDAEKATNKIIREKRKVLEQLMSQERQYSFAEMDLMDQIKQMQEYLEDADLSRGPSNESEMIIAVQNVATRLANIERSIINADKEDIAIESVDFSKNAAGDFDLKLNHVNGKTTEFWEVPFKDVEILFGEGVARKMLLDGSGFHEMKTPTILENNKLYARMMDNMGKYVTRSYMAHDSADFAKNWREIVGPGVYNDAFMFIKNQYTNPSIHRVEVTKTPNGQFNVVFTNKYGIKSSPIVLNSLNRLEIERNGPLTKKNVELIQKRMEVEGDKVEMSLTRPTNAQSFVKFPISREAIEGIMDRIVTKDGFKNMYQGMPINGFDGSIFKQKGDIPEPIRKLMGEYTDPYINSTKTLLKMAAAIENGRLVQDMIDQGPGIFISDKQTKYHSVKISRSEVYSLGDRVYYVTPEVYDALFAKSIKKDRHWFYQTLITLSASAKAANTIYYPESQARNFFGAALNMLATGNFNYGDLKYAMSISSQDLSKAQDIVGSIMSTPLFVLRLIAGKSFGYNGKAGKGKYDKEALRDNFIKASKYGVINENLDASVINDLHSLLSDNKMKERYQNVTDAFAKPYQLSDNVFKVTQWLNEMKTLEKAYPDKSEEWVMEHAADIVRRLSPTYSMLPEAVQRLGRFPLIGSFVMFPTAMIKTRVEIIKQISKEITSGNDVLIQRAGLRMAGLTGTIAMGYILYEIFANIFNWDDDENEAVNNLSPSYAQNNLRLYLSSDKKNVEFIDLTYIDPSSIFYKPVIAFNRDEGKILSKTKAALGEVTTPYVSTDIFTAALFESLEGKDEYGIPIYNKTDSDLQKTAKGIGHTMEAVLPKFLDSYERLYMAATGKETEYGRTYELDNELANLFVGAKSRTIDEAKSGKTKVRNAWAMMQEPAQLYKQKKLSLEEANARSEKYYNEIVSYTNSLKELGFADDEIYGNFAYKTGRIKRDGGILSEAGVSRYIINQVEKGTFEGIDEEGETLFNK